MTTAWPLAPTIALLVLAAAGAATAATAASGPSFDCAKAAAADERAICANSQLAHLDAMIATAYARFTPMYGNKRAIGTSLLDDRHACGSDTACIAAVQVNALETYGSTVPWADAYVQALIGEKAAGLSAILPRDQDQPLPGRIGDCAITHIDQLTTRFGDPLKGADPADGSAVVFANGGAQVSYDVVDALALSENGDPVIMCLVSIPRDCPVNDVRGRIYYTLDLRSNDTWQLPDSQHICGGA